jgi:signal peptidase II
MLFFLTQIRYVFTICLVIFCDQVSKIFFIDFFQSNPEFRYYINEYLDFVYVWNYGISFGFLSSYKYSNILFLLINSFIILVLAFLRLKKIRLEGFAYDLIIGGAIGNISDRIIKGGVFDFIYFHYKSYGFPVFNLADVFISVGFFIIICQNVFIKEKHIA